MLARPVERLPEGGHRRFQALHAAPVRQDDAESGLALGIGLGPGEGLQPQKFETFIEHRYLLRHRQVRAPIHDRVDDVVPGPCKRGRHQKGNAAE